MILEHGERVSLGRRATQVHGQQASRTGGGAIGRTASQKDPLREIRTGGGAIGGTLLPVEGTMMPTVHIVMPGERGVGEAGSANYSMVMES